MKRAVLGHQILFWKFFLHTSKKDIKIKYEVYEEAGIPKYWIVYLKNEVIEVYQLIERKYQKIDSYFPGDEVSPKLFLKLVISLDDIFEKW